MMKHVLRLLSVSVLIATTVHGLEVASVFTDHMVLQQGTPAPVWGTGAPGESITVTFSGPVFDKLNITGNQAILSFQHVGDGLVAHGDKLVGFEISSDGTQFDPATATIVGNTVVVTSDAVTHPVAVRFGWANVPETNLFNKNGLPATPFRTDNH